MELSREENNAALRGVSTMPREREEFVSHMVPR